MITPPPLPGMQPAEVDVDGDEEVEFSVSPWNRMWEVSGQGSISTSSQATLVSIVLHVVAIVLIAEISVPKTTHDLVMEIHSWLITPDEEIKPIEPVLTLAPPSDEPDDSALASIAESVAAIESEMPELLPDTEDIVEVENPQIKLPEQIDQPVEGIKMSDVIVRPGSVGEEVVNVDGAVDRITHELALRLEQGPVFVIWLLDQSISLEDERIAVADRMSRVYKEIGDVGQGRSSGLLAAVVGFGERVTEAVPPTSEAEKIINAIRSLPNDPSGVENVFSSIIYGIERFKPMITAEGRQCMVVVWTDESGDDILRVEEAVALCRRYDVPVFSVGPSAMFGRQMGTHSYLNPEDEQIYELPVMRGPDTSFQERLALPYWFEGDQLEVLHSGLGPYALVRLSMESGGAYFINDAERDRSPFRLEAMRDYMPSYASITDYQKQVSSSPLRRAISMVVAQSHQLKFKNTPQLQFAPTGETFVDDLRDAQMLTAYNIPRLEPLLAAFGPKGMEAEYEKEESPRWRAWYDLTYGRLLAMYVRNSEYNWVCAEMKGKGADFVNKESNRWTFKPDKQIRMGSSNERMAQEAIRLLTRCIEQNPGTPWEALARRELKFPVGFKIEESYVAPPPPPPMGPPSTVPPPPPPPPNMTIRTEKPKMLERPKQVTLPKL